MDDLERRDSANPGIPRPTQQRRNMYQSETLVDELRAMIASGKYKEGDRLASEHDLTQTWGFSRAVVREALRVLSDIGLIRTRRGPHGGIFVARPGIDHVARSLGVALEVGRVDLAQLFEARLELESAAIRLAATRVLPHELQQLRDSCQRFWAAAEQGDRDQLIQENLDFHARLVAASHNEVLALLHSAIRELILLSTREPLYSVDAQREVARAHEAIVAALAEGDAEVASRRVRRHLAAFEHYLKVTNQYELLRQRFRM